MQLSQFLQIPRPIITMWVIIAVLAVFSILATKNLKEVPGPIQNAAESAIEFLQGFFAGIIGEKTMRRYFPLFATMFIFIIVSNYSGLLPGAGDFFAVATASLSVTALLWMSWPRVTTLFPLPAFFSAMLTARCTPKQNPADSARISFFIPPALSR